MVKWVHFFRQLFVTADIPNPDEMLGTDSVVQQTFQEAIAMAASGQSPGQQSPGGGAAQGAENVVPILGGTG